MKYFGAIGRVIPPAGPDLFLLWICYLGAWLSKTRELCCLKPVRVPSSLGSSSKGLPKGCGNLLVMFRKALTYKFFSSIYWYKSGPFLQCRYTPAHVFSKLFFVQKFRDFVSRTNLEREANGSLLLWGKVGKVHPFILLCLSR